MSEAFECRVFLVGSGKGGVGKSTVSVALAKGLSDRGYRVGLLDADVYGPSVAHITGAKSKITFDENKNFVPLESGGIKFVSVALMVDPGKALIWRGPMLAKMLKRMFLQTAWGPLDYLVVDLPPGTGDVQLTLAQNVPNAFALLVSTPQRLSLIDVEKAADMFKAVHIPILGLVENMTYYCSKEGGDLKPLFCCGGGSYSLPDSLDVQSLAKIPFNPLIAELCDSGLFIEKYKSISSYYDVVTDSVLGLI